MREARGGGKYGPGAMVVSYVPHGVLITVLAGIGAALIADREPKQAG